MAALLAPFSSALLWAAVLSLALFPLYKRVVLALKGRAGIAAGIMSLGTLLMVIGPTVLLLAVLANQAVDLYAWASDLVKTGKLTESWARVAEPLIVRIQDLPFLQDVDVRGLLLKGASEFSSLLAGSVGGLLKNTLLFAVNLLITLIALFFFFRDGKAFYTLIIDLLPFTEEQQQTIAKKFQETFTAVINGVFLVALLQGLMTGIGLAVFGVPFPVLWGFLASILALLPVGGAALVWLPAAVYLYLSGSTVSGLLLAVWGTVLVSLPDNFLKPLLIGKKANIPISLLFIGILGGLQVYGFLGILAGPLVVTMLTVFVQIYRAEFMEKQ
jgi:predicted PurR-regulated permease PerM